MLATARVSSGPVVAKLRSGPAAMTPKDRCRYLGKLDEAVNAVRRAHLPMP